MKDSKNIDAGRKSVDSGRKPVDLEKLKTSLVGKRLVISRDLGLPSDKPLKGESESSQKDSDEESEE